MFIALLRDLSVFFGKFVITAVTQISTLAANGLDQARRELDTGMSGSGAF